MIKEVTLYYILRTLTRYWWVILFSIIASTLYFLNATSKQPIIYKISMKVKSTSNQGSEGLSSGIFSIPGVTGAPRGNNFDVYKYYLTSQAVAEHIISDHDFFIRIYPTLWDAERNVWKEQVTSNYRRFSMIYDKLQIPASRTPNAMMVAEYLQSVVSIETEAGFITNISVNMPDRQFAIDLLTRIDAAADEIVRKNVLDETSNRISYLENQINNVSQLAIREVLISEYAVELRKAALAQQGQRYAAEILQEPIAGDLPISPNVQNNLIFGFASGLILSIGGIITIDALTGGALGRRKKGAKITKDKK